MSSPPDTSQLTECMREDENVDGKTKLRKWLNMNFRIEMTDGRVLIGVFLCTDRDANVILGKLRKWLNMNFRIEMTDGRVLIGVFLCTDRDAHVILGACSEYLKSNDGEAEEPRVLGLVMVPGRHIVSIQIDDMTAQRRNASIMNDTMLL